MKNAFGVFPENPSNVEKENPLALLNLVYRRLVKVLGIGNLCKGHREWVHPFLRF